MFSSVLVLSLLGSIVAAAPCDFYNSGGTTCVAGHSTVRALYDAYNGPLYQVIRKSDGTTKDIAPLSAGGVANGPAQDSFCANTDCNITIIYDQSTNHNDLTPAPPGGAFQGPGPNGYDYAANAKSAPVLLNGHQVYGVYVTQGIGYRSDKAAGTAKGDDPEGIYAVFDGTHYNNVCCFDYGNAETNNKDNGSGHMEAIYFGNTGSGGSGNGPWIQADMENGIFSGSDTNKNPNLPSMTSQFVTTVFKGKADRWVIRGGDASSGSLTTYFSGARPSGYDPMKKEGAIILGIGGDNSDRAVGTFFEGAMTLGYPSDNSEQMVQSNIVAAKYAKNG